MALFIRDFASIDCKVNLIGNPFKAMFATTDHSAYSLSANVVKDYTLGCSQLSTRAGLI